MRDASSDDAREGSTTSPQADVTRAHSLLRIPSSSVIGRRLESIDALAFSKLLACVARR
jgi:hypothetical protein